MKVPEDVYLLDNFSIKILYSMLRDFLKLRYSSAKALYSEESGVK